MSGFSGRALAAERYRRNGIQKQEKTYRGNGYVHYVDCGEGFIGV